MSIFPGSDAPSSTTAMATARRAWRRLVHQWCCLPPKRAEPRRRILAIKARMLSAEAAMVPTPATTDGLQMTTVPTTPVPDPGRHPDVVWVSHSVGIAQSQEIGVTLTEREYRRYLQRLDDCKGEGWSDLWLAMAGMGGGLSVAALVTAIALPSSMPSADKDVLWMLTVLGGVIFGLCLIAYFTQRHRQGEKINDLKTDMEMHVGQRTNGHGCGSCEGTV